jgi:IrrE N-terminal-like domain
MAEVALDSDLAQLGRREIEGTELPIALRRFRNHVGSDSALSAMQQVTHDLLRDCPGTDENSTGRISAGRLCEACGLTLEGAPGRRSAGRPVYSAIQPDEGRNTHTGVLRLHPERPTIQLPTGLDLARARVTVGHEIGHFLIHRRGAQIDMFTARLPSTREEETLAEYAARLLLLPAAYRTLASRSSNLMSECMILARSSDVTIHTAAARLADPDTPISGLRGVILWRLNPAVAVEEPVPQRLTPQWHLCAGTFIPIRRCHASRQSLVAELGSMGERMVAGSRVEPVHIGSLRGTFRVDAVAWGSVSRGTRLVLAAFVVP